MCFSAGLASQAWTRHRGFLLPELWPEGAASPPELGHLGTKPFSPSLGTRVWGQRASSQPPRKARVLRRVLCFLSNTDPGQQLRQEFTELVFFLMKCVPEAGGECPLCFKVGMVP